jgi:4-hydroxybenzoate polyprenyltransferase
MEGFLATAKMRLHEARKHDDCLPSGTQEVFRAKFMGYVLSVTAFLVTAFLSSPPFVSPPFVTAFLSCHRLFVTAFYRLFSSLQSQKKTWK